MNIEKILNTHSNVLNDHIEFTTPNWFKKTSNLSVVVHVTDVDSFIYCYETSQVLAEYIIVSNHTNELLDYFEINQKPVGKLVNYFNDNYTKFELFQIGAMYSSNSHIVYLDQSIVPPTNLDFNQNINSSCIIKEDEKVMSAGRLWMDNKFVDIGNNWYDFYIPISLKINKLRKETIKVDSLHALCFTCPKEIIKQYLFFDDFFLSNNCFVNTNSVATLIAENNYVNDLDTDLFYNKWIASNRLGDYHKIRGILVKASSNVDHIIKELKEKYNCKIYLISDVDSEFADKRVQSYHDCERLVQLVVNCDY